MSILLVRSGLGHRGLRIALSAAFLLGGWSDAGCSAEHAKTGRLGAASDIQQGDASCPALGLPEAVSTLNGPDPITAAELATKQRNVALNPCLSEADPGQKPCSVHGWTACDVCLDQRCLRCVDAASSPVDVLTFPVCWATGCSAQDFAMLSAADRKECALRLSWNELPADARLWLNPDLAASEICANLTRTRFRIRYCGAEVVVRDFGWNFQGKRDREAYVCAYPAEADVWSAAFPYRSCRGASWGFDSDDASAYFRHDPVHPRVFRHEGALCVRVADPSGNSAFLRWSPESAEELAHLKTTTCDPK